MLDDAGLENKKDAERESLGEKTFGQRQVWKSTHKVPSKSEIVIWEECVGVLGCVGGVCEVFGSRLRQGSR